MIDDLQLATISSKWIPGATAARLTPDQKVIRSNRVGFRKVFWSFIFS
jgi:hypothetical protein